MPNEIVLSADRIVKTYTVGKRTVEAVKEISFDVFKNEIFALLGPNGSGKTSTIKMLLGLTLPNAGCINMLGFQIPKDVNKVLGHTGAILEGARNLYWHMSVMENVYYFANIKGKEVAQVKEPMELWAEKLNMANNLNMPVGRLSRGMQQKAALICCLAMNPSILILDEPLLGLDVMTMFEMEDAIRELKKYTTVILSSHNLRFVERVADRLAILKEGSLIAMGPINELKKSISLFQFRLTLQKREANWGYLQDIESMHSKGVKVKVTEVDDYTDIVELTLSQPELIFDIMSTLKEYNAVPIEISTLGESFEEVFLSLIERGEQLEACV
ncbi:ABC transporter ATP-binding protein [Anaerobranca gottschalkii]|uniref:ABC-2 type transport system ATP-binding protein n=1 Tax=Anaerobranca gottschalkii DSM 13577 TaxID=1120990 RepID=A0A1I0CC08_9FIRM|nr:ABC transporter ATP-binding protein [Anaerobranca gottschalkii]SET17057.1 ABC-2 type transport system ATP-binding protein [Anaerobranca gottschalkii DSM 13577]